MFDVFALWDTALVFAVVFALAPFFGGYLARVYQNRPAFGDRVLQPIESAVYRLLGTSPRRSMTAREYTVAVLLFSAVTLVWLFAWFYLQGILPDNPGGVPGMSWDLAFHSSSAFVTNTDFVHFTPEVAIGQGVALFAIQLAMFTSAATGLSVGAAFARGFIRRDGTLGNFYVDLVRTMTRVLVPVALLAGFLLALFGVPETLATYAVVHPVVGGSQVIPLGPVASFQSISLLGSNGGGFYAANAGTPLANPSEASNLFEIGLMLLLPISFPFAFAQIVRRPGEGLPFVATMITVLFLGLGLFLAYQSIANADLSGSSAVQALGGVLPGSNGYPVGQETRFSFGSAAAFQVVSVYANVGANNMALGALSPIGQTSMLFGMFTQSTPGGDGTGFATLLVNAILAIFVGGLMVGRTPEYLGKKIGQAQVRWAAAILLIHPVAILLPLAGAVLGGFDPVNAGLPAVQAHSFTTVLYEFTSEAANNGSGMAPINDATPYFNLAGGVVMLVGRFLPIIGMLAIGGKFAEQEVIPAGPGTLKTRSVTFTVYLTAFLIVITGLLFLPVLALGPLSQLGL